jgi:C-terminal processing protease CtpA/Prc
MKKKFSIIGLFMALVLLLTACGPKPLGTNEPYKITGNFDYSSVDYVLDERWVEPAVALVDMYGFVTRDQEWTIPVASQYLGYLKQDSANKTASYELWLPEKPEATLVDVDNNGKKDTGVQIFAVAWWDNTYGGIYAEGDDQARGWPSFLASVKTDEQQQYEVTGGMLVVWAPDGNQKFPTGFGADGKLFTSDDPVKPLPAGWNIVNLDQSPFTFTKQSVPEMTLYQPTYISTKEFSALSYTDSFEQLFAFVKQNYAFNGIEGKQPDWNAVYARIKPMIDQAQANKDPSAFYFALQQFTYAFKDGHVGMSQNDIWYNAFTQATSGGYGFAIRELDDGRFINIYLSDKGPAALAGMQVGAQITQFNGKPISQAVSEVTPWTLPESTDWLIRYQQARYLLRALLGTDATVTFVNPGAQPQTVTLKAIEERDSFARTSLYFGVDTSQWLVPVDFKILPSGVGYIGIRTNEDDVNLILKLFERALKTFKSKGVPGIIIDMRYNSGGLPLGLAGFLTDKEIPLGQTEYYSATAGKFVPEGVSEKFSPNVEQYHFDKMVLLVGPNCGSACEEDAYGFSQVPGMTVVGMFPTAGAFGEVSRGQVSMPDGISMQFPLGRYVKADGSLFLEGVGVVPTQRVPITEQTVLTTEDVVLKAGEDAILNGTTASIPPASTNGPRVMSTSETQSALSGTDMFEQRATEQYQSSDYLKVPNNFTFSINLSHSEPLLWAWGWCAKDKATLTDNLSKMKVTFTLNGKEVPQSSFLTQEGASQGQECSQMAAAVTDWPSGESHAITTLTFTAPVNDGSSDYPSGQQVFDYVVKLP